ncbi:hypothetical protein CPB86DRAFT_814496 [Serendipita vermifera]|nr:hypothetical protein CPB86DRAFT_814496 [Serendipita vermifera]
MKLLSLFALSLSVTYSFAVATEEAICYTLLDEADVATKPAPTTTQTVTATICAAGCPIITPTTTRTITVKPTKTITLPTIRPCPTYYTLLKEREEVDTVNDIAITRIPIPPPCTIRPTLTVRPTTTKTSTVSCPVCTAFPTTKTVTVILPTPTYYTLDYIACPLAETA